MHPPSAQPDPAWLRCRQAYHHLVFTLGTTLPPPPTDSPENRDRRDSSAIAQVAALLPANAAEATLAAQYVAACAQSMDVLRLANQPGMDPSLALKCAAQAASMMRQAQSALRLLLRAQAVRQKREADSGQADAAAWTEYCAAGLMEEARSVPQEAGPGGHPADDPASCPAAAAPHPHTAPSMDPSDPVPARPAGPTLVFAHPEKTRTEARETGVSTSVPATAAGVRQPALDAHPGTPTRAPAPGARTGRNGETAGIAVTAQAQWTAPVPGFPKHP